MKLLKIGQMQTIQFKLIEISKATDILRISKTNYGHIRKHYTLTYEK
jgi:hypothetical protein